jgi:hypothetical protein
MMRFFVPLIDAEEVENSGEFAFHWYYVVVSERFVI